MGKVYKALTKALDGDKTKESKPGESLPGKKNEQLGQTLYNAEDVPLQRSEELIEERITEIQDIQLTDINDRLFVLNDSFSGITEGFRRLRTQILHPATGRPPKSVLVTSVAPQEGKSFICANLGVVFAQGIEQYALMVDCDLRRPTLAGIFGLSNDNGVVDHLIRGEDLSKFIKKTQVQKLSLLPSGRPPLNPAELLTSDKMEALVKEVVERYDDRFVILDSPPMYSASETAVLAKIVDGIILVIRWGVSGREQVKKFVDGIDQDRILGVVFNGYEETIISSKLSGSYYNSYA